MADADEIFGKRIDPYSVLQKPLGYSGDPSDPQWREYVDKYVNSYLKQNLASQVMERLGVEREDVMSSLGYVPVNYRGLSPNQARDFLPAMVTPKFRQWFQGKNPLPVSAAEVATQSAMEVFDAPLNQQEVGYTQRKIVSDIPSGSAAGIVISSAADVMALSEVDALSYVLENTSPSERASREDALNKSGINAIRMAVMVQSGILTPEMRQQVLETLQNAQTVKEETGYQQSQMASTEVQLDAAQSRELQTTGGITLDTGAAMSEDARHDAEVNRVLSEAAGGYETLEGYGLAFMGIRPKGWSEAAGDALIAQQYMLSGDVMYREYSAGNTFGIDLTGVRLYNRSEKRGGGQQFITTKGFGRNITDDLLGKLKGIIGASILRNYGEKITDRTGALKVAIEFGEVKIAGADHDATILVIEFTPNYQAADQVHSGAVRDPDRPTLGFRSSKWINKRTGQQYSTTPSFYGPLVFMGRRGIISQDVMTFKIGDRWVKTHHVGPSQPKDPFFLDSNGMVEAADAISAKFGDMIVQAFIDFGTTYKVD